MEVESSTGEPRRRYPASPIVGVAVSVFRPAPDSTLARAGAHENQPHEGPAGQVLLVQRKRAPRAGEWGLPGGVLQLGERLVDGIQRELWEECRITAKIGAVIDTFEPIQYDAAGRVEYHYVVIEYWASYESGVARANDDAAAVHWVGMDELATLQVRPDTQRIIEHAYRAWMKTR
jgi:8-oxo-dGTP diphosphatase